VFNLSDFLVTYPTIWHWSEMPMVALNNK
jgi:hypothetical protein